MIRICVIGAGPSGLSFIREIQRIQQEEENLPEFEIVCFEKQSSWGGQWNFNWRTGVDEFGEPVHNTMYHHLWTNAPKEAFEFYDYTYEEHFKKLLPSYIPRSVMLDYLNGYWKKNKLDEYDIRYNHVIKKVTFNSETNTFTVRAKDLINDTMLEEEVFDYVVNCAGHFSTPHKPNIPGIETFPSTVLHSGEIRHFDMFRDKKVLVVGAGISGYDIAVQAVKFGANSAIISHRSQKITMPLPPEITQLPEVKQINGYKITFIDGTESEVDTIILATGYIHHYPYMEDDLRLRGPNLYFPKGLYNCTVWLNGGNGRLLYSGAMNQFMSFPMFKIQGRWAAMYVLGMIKLPSDDKVEEHCQRLYKKESEIRCCTDRLKVQSEWCEAMAAECRFGVDINVSDLLYQWHLSREEYGIAGYKDVCFKSKYTGKTAPKLYEPHMKIMDSGLENFLSKYRHR